MKGLRLKLQSVSGVTEAPSRFWQSGTLVKGKIMSKVSEREKLQRDIGSLVDELSRLRTKLDQLDPKLKNKRTAFTRGDILFP
jgi:hypothetical protein